jgi:hypothetical protein
VPIAIYIAIACLITLFSVWTLRETKGISLQDVDAEDRRRLSEEKAVRDRTS